MSFFRSKPVDVLKVLSGCMIFMLMISCVLAGAEPGRAVEG